MCDGGDLPDVYVEDNRRARLPHDCSACELPIRPGDEYTAIRGLWDGRWGSFKLCIRCKKIYEALIDSGVDSVQLDLNCGEVWKSPPPEVEALAFALPDDWRPRP
jgi:hypothetical protein